MRVLLAGLGEHKDFGLRSLRDAGHFLGVIEEPLRVPFDFCDWWAFADCRDLPSVLAAAASAVVPWDAVLCWEEVAIDVAHEAAARLGIAHPRMPAGHFRDKELMHRRVRAAGLATPQVGAAASLAAAGELGSGNYPLVIKPADYGGSCGVSVVAQESQLAEAFQAAATLSYTGRVVVDRYVVGPEFSVEAVTLAPGQTEVVCVVAKRVTQPPYCAELGHLAPARLAERERCALAEYAGQVLDALEMHAGVSHGEYRLTEEGPMLMEVAGRPAGGSIPRLVDLVTGCNLYRAELSAATGTPIPRTQAAHRSAAVHFFTGNGATATYRPLTIDEATAPPLAGILHDLRYWVPPETVLRVPQDVDDRAGLALVAGEPDQVDAAMAALVARAAGPAVAGEAD